jgi:hypothetical protein
MSKRTSPLTLQQKYPPSPPCDCDVCRAFCRRPGWWTVCQARDAMDSGLGARMMLEVSPDRTFGVLSPAFSGCEGNFALQELSHRGCTFLRQGLCELHGTNHMPLECRFCHHSSIGAGKACHADLERDWRTARGQALVNQWLNEYGISARFFAAQAALAASMRGATR